MGDEKDPTNYSKRGIIPRTVYGIFTAINEGDEK